MKRLWFTLVLIGLLSVEVAGQSVETHRDLQLALLGSWMDENPGLSVCITGVAKPVTWKTPVVPDAEIPRPSKSDLDAIATQLGVRYPTRVSPYCIPVRDGRPTSELHELLRRAERAAECSAVRSLVIDAEARGASPEEINEIFRSRSTSSCYPSSRSLVDPYGARAVRLAISSPLILDDGSAMLLMAPSYTTSRNDYLFCSYERRGEAWSPAGGCERVTYTH